ncbi:hypothetical protein PanWU01x14_136130 [Parasponia andersonii]|uniref:Uncharacterized protein n=1 Tax=Parasponia andersonii TaxID=3476 RepID=A0A2P5CNU1_PARAD|nr:hypothetical protein PanWU01x14_136130 [Parasponia andersonii]
MIKRTTTAAASSTTTSTKKASTKTSFGPAYAIQVSCCPTTGSSKDTMTKPSPRLSVASEEVEIIQAVIKRTTTAASSSTATFSAKKASTKTSFSPTYAIQVSRGPATGSSNDTMTKSSPRLSIATKWTVFIAAASGIGTYAI